MEGLVWKLTKSKWVSTAEVQRAMQSLKREHFVSKENALLAYDDRPLPIGHGQTISAPHVHALALEVARETLARETTSPLRPTVDAWILDVGSGSGYLTGAFAALLKEMNIKGHVVGIERCKPLADQSKENLANAGCAALLRSGAISIHCRSAFSYTSDHLFDFIHVGAAANELPQNLVGLLRDGGRLLLPIGPNDEGGVQEMSLVTKQGSSVEIKGLLQVRYVPLVEDEP
jgi:protein-L-isoaspartate(D-aspartate) O-methyltransferase